MPLGLKETNDATSKPLTPPIVNVTELVPLLFSTLANDSQLLARTISKLYSIAVNPLAGVTSKVIVVTSVSGPRFEFHLYIPVFKVK